MKEIKLTDDELNILIGGVKSYIRICNNASPEPPHLTEMKEYFLKTINKVIIKLENQNK
jgi:hypothetical protein